MALELPLEIMGFSYPLSYWKISKFKACADGDAFNGYQPSLEITLDAYADKAAHDAAPGRNKIIGASKTYFLTGSSMSTVAAAGNLMAMKSAIYDYIIVYQPDPQIPADFAGAIKSIDLPPPPPPPAPDPAPSPEPAPSPDPMP